MLCRTSISSTLDGSDALAMVVDPAAEKSDQWFLVGL